mmetsp:Transcript_13475/g.23277  ORF Transcript_13475/g.23277 Transcript_13475/m.23277 type:complete len:207 (+) Transcript_13475:261-881(+)
MLKHRDALVVNQRVGQHLFPPLCQPQVLCQLPILRQYLLLNPLLNQPHYRLQQQHHRRHPIPVHLATRSQAVNNALMPTRRARALANGVKMQVYWEMVCVAMRLLQIVNQDMLLKHPLMMRVLLVHQHLFQHHFQHRHQLHLQLLYQHPLQHLIRHLIQLLNQHLNQHLNQRHIQLQNQLHCQHQHQHLSNQHHVLVSHNVINVQT